MARDQVARDKIADVALAQEELGREHEVFIDALKAVREKANELVGLYNKMADSIEGGINKLKIQMVTDTRSQAMELALRHYEGLGTDVDAREVVQAAEHFRSYLEGRTRFSWIPPKEGEEEGSILPDGQYENITEFDLSHTDTEVQTEPIKRPQTPVDYEESDLHYVSSLTKEVAQNEVFGFPPNAEEGEVYHHRNTHTDWVLRGDRWRRATQQDLRRI